MKIFHWLVSLPPTTPFFKGEDRVSKKLGKERNFFGKSVGETKMRWDFFIFIFSLLAIMVTDTAFRKSRLGKLILEKIIPGTSKNHTDLLVFCLKFKLPPVCEYLNYYYNITNDFWAIPEKIQTGGIEDILF